MLISNFQNGCMDFLPSLPGSMPVYDVCSEFHIEHVVRQLDKLDVPERILIVVNDHNVRSYEFLFSVVDLYDRNNILSKIAAHGLVIPTWYQTAVVTLLFNEYQDCCCSGFIEYKHSTLGWYRQHGSYVYLSQTTQIGREVSHSDRETFKFSGGSYKEYSDFLDEVVYPVPTLALAMAIGYSAVVVSRLQEEYDLGTLIINLCGASSTGKTTVSQLLVSPFACPTISNKEGLIRTFHATTNALFAGIDGINGMPIVLDDVTTNPYINLPNLIYTLASGEEKSRCTASGGISTSNAGWSGVVVISSETPIQDERSQNQGLQVRVLNTQGITWTPDAKTAELIKATIQRSYGFTGPVFAKHVEGMTTDELRTLFDAAQLKVHALMPNRDKLSDRLETKYTAIYLTIELMNACFKLSLDADALMRIMIQPEQDAVADRDIATKALGVVETCMVKESRHFDVIYRDDINMEPSIASGERYGVIIHKGRRCDVYFLCDQLKELLYQHGIYEISTVKKMWKDRGISKCDTGRLDCKREQLRCVHLIYPNGLPSMVDFIDYDEEQQTRCQRRLATTTEVPEGSANE